MVVTGGWYTEDLVVRYNRQGDVTQLPNLNNGRRTHACGYYLNTDNQKVRWCNIIFVLGVTGDFVLQVLLVTGGYESGDYLSSTEIHETGSNKWQFVGNLPRPVYGLREDFQKYHFHKHYQKFKFIISFKSVEH